MTLFRVLAGVAILLLSVPATYGQTTYSTGFEPPTFVVGDVNGQDGWGHISNSPTRGAIVLAPVGAPAGSGLQSLQILTRDVGMFGVSNHLFSATLNPGAGETNSTAGTTMFAAPPTNFQASFWFRTPAAPVISTRPDGVFAELDPSSKGYVAGDVANRYARVRLINTTNTAAGFVRVQMGWYQTPALFLSANVAELAWDQWYRFEYNIQLVDGIASSGEANDRFVLTIFNAAGTQVGSGCGSTWELPLSRRGIRRNRHTSQYQWI